MWPGFEDSRRLWVFGLRNALLYFLFLHAYLYLREDLSLAFLSGGFVAAAALAAVLERARLRLWLAALSFAGAAVAARLALFLVFRLQTLLAPGPETDFLYFSFDQNFVPALLPWAVVWLFNFLGLRYRSFVRYEAAALGLLLVAVFWPQARYRVTLYPHPSFLAWALFGYLLLQLLVLILSRPGEPGADSHMTAPASAGAPPPAPGSGRSAGRRIRWRRELATLGSFGWLAVPVLLVLLLFVLGRFNEGAVRLGGGLMKPTLFRFDFSEYIRLQSEIEMSDDLVLLFRKEGPAEKILLRRYMLSGYDRARGFFRVQEQELDPLPVTVPDSPESYPDPGYAGRAPVGQEYYFVNFDPSSLIGMNYPVRVVPLTNWDSSSFQRIYRVESRVSSASAAELARVAARPLSPAAMRHYTAYGGDPRLRGLAEEITAGLPAEDLYARASAIRDYLKRGYYYSLTPGIAADGDQLSHFLYESRKGYCSYFAFAMALLCRSIGIPARVAVGFYVNPETEVLNFYEVRAYQAHAWVEVYFGEYGWIEFDPSSEQIAPGEEYTLQFGFDFERFARLLEEILSNQDRLREASPAPAEVSGRVRLLGGELLRGLLWLARLSYLILPGAYLILVGLLRGVPLLLARCDPDPRRKVRRLFAAGLRRLRGLGLRRRRDESWLEYGVRLEEEHGLRARGLTDVFLESVFAESFEAEDGKRAEDRWDEFARSLRLRYGVLRRLAGLFNPLALGRRGS